MIYELLTACRQPQVQVQGIIATIEGTNHTCHDPWHVTVTQGGVRTLTNGWHQAHAYTAAALSMVTAPQLATKAATCAFSRFSCFPCVSVACLACCFIPRAAVRRPSLPSSAG